MTDKPRMTALRLHKALYPIWRNDPGWKGVLTELVVPLRHLESGGQLILCGMARFAFGATITQAAAYSGFDRVGNAQVLSRAGIALGGGTADLLTEAKEHWMDDAALPDLLERRGRVVTVASTLGLRALSDATAYCASKFGVVGFTRALTVELQGRVGVTMLVPGGMHTAFFDGRDEQYKPGPDARLNQPADVAAAVVFALDQPEGCQVRELVITPSVEGSWP